MQWKSTGCKAKDASWDEMGAQWDKGGAQGGKKNNSKMQIALELTPLHAHTPQ